MSVPSISSREQIPYQRNVTQGKENNYYAIHKQAQNDTPAKKTNNYNANIELLKKTGLVALGILTIIGVVALWNHYQSGTINILEDQQPEFPGSDSWKGNVVANTTNTGKIISNNLTDTITTALFNTTFTQNQTDSESLPISNFTAFSEKAQKLFNSKNITDISQLSLEEFNTLFADRQFFDEDGTMTIVKGELSLVPYNQLLKAVNTFGLENVLAAASDAQRKYITQHIDIASMKESDCDILFLEKEFKEFGDVALKEKTANWPETTRIFNIANKLCDERELKHPSFNHIKFIANNIDVSKMTDKEIKTYLSNFWSAHGNYPAIKITSQLPTVSTDRLMAIVIKSGLTDSFAHASKAQQKYLAENVNLSHVNTNDLEFLFSNYTFTDKTYPFVKIQRFSKMSSDELTQVSKKFELHNIVKYCDDAQKKFLVGNLDIPNMNEKHFGILFNKVNFDEFGYKTIKSLLPHASNDQLILMFKKFGVKNILEYSTPAQKEFFVLNINLSLLSNEDFSILFNRKNYDEIGYKNIKSLLPIMPDNKFMELVKIFGVKNLMEYSTASQKEYLLKNIDLSSLSNEDFGILFNRKNYDEIDYKNIKSLLPIMPNNKFMELVKIFGVKNLMEYSTASQKEYLVKNIDLSSLSNEDFGILFNRKNYDEMGYKNIKSLTPLVDNKKLLQLVKKFGEQQVLEYATVDQKRFIKASSKK